MSIKKLCNNKFLNLNTIISENQKKSKLEKEEIEKLNR